MTWRELFARYSLPDRFYFKSMQLLSFCKARLKDLTVVGTATLFDDLLSTRPGEYGVSSF